jgi:hypothetical protein
MINPLIKPVQGFKTSDGEFFHDQSAAEAHQLQLSFREWCRNNIGGDWTGKMVADKVLEDWLITPRPSKVNDPDDDIPF